MRDTKLFQYIQTLIREGHNTRPTEPSTFAERYCKEQMMKKKLNANKNGEKMAHLMKNFKGLETFVDLPELIEAVKIWRFNQTQHEKEQMQRQLQQQRQSITSNKKRQGKSLPVFRNQQCMRSQTKLELQSKIKKQLGVKMKSKYLIQNTIADELLQSLQRTTTINSAGLKNNSANNINMLYERVSDEGEDIAHNREMGFMDCLNFSDPGFNIKSNQSNEVAEWLDFGNHQNQQKLERETRLKLRKQYSKLLHKITTYIQIVLQMQHRQRWESKRQNHRSNKLHKTVIIIKTSNNHNKENLLIRSHIINHSNKINKNIFNSNHNTINNANINNKSDKLFQLLTPINKKQNVKFHTMAHNTSISKMVKTKLLKQQSQQVQNNQQSIAFVQKGQKHNNMVQSELSMAKLKKKAVFLHRKQFSNYPEEDSINTQDNDNDIRKTTISMTANTRDRTYMRSNLRSSEGSGNDSFLKTTYSSILRKQAIKKRHQNFKSEGKQPMSSFSIANNPRKPQSVKENFTFRNRNIKQKIINRLGSFIREIDEQEHNNKKQNHYFMNAINRLENTLGLGFGQFRQESLAGERDIETVKQYANAFGNGGGGPVSSKFINFENDLPVEMKSKKEIN